MNKLKIIPCLAVILLISGCGINFSPGDGEKIGQVVKVNHQGWQRVTWEAQLIRGGMNNGSGAFGVAPFDFTIESEDMAKKVQEYMKSQQQVIIRYRMEGCWSLFRSDSNGHFLTSIEPSTNNVASQ